jgi:hypothetical protein
MEIVRGESRSSKYHSSAHGVARGWQVIKLWHGGVMRATGGAQGPFSFFNRAEPGGQYPKITLKNGTMEYYIIDGTFQCNGETFHKGDWVLFSAGETMDWSSRTGGEFLLTLRGELEWADESAAGA